VTNDSLGNPSDKQFGTTLFLLKTMAFAAKGIEHSPFSSKVSQEKK
jgi:hypothetical protein